MGNGEEIGLQIIRVMLVNRTWKDIEAEIYGDYAVHYTLFNRERDQPYYSITHIQSGWMLGETSLLEDARNFANDMNKHKLQDSIVSIRKHGKPAKDALFEKRWMSKLLNQYQITVNRTK